MNSGKLTPAQCKRSVLKQIKTEDPILRGAGIGGDYAAFSASEDLAVVTAVGSCNFATKHPERYAFAKAWNKCLASGAIPQTMMVNLELPARGSEERIRLLTQALSEYAKKKNIGYMGGHTELFTELRTPLITIIMYGSTKKDRLFNRISSCKPGMNIFQLGAMAVEATAMLYHDRREQLLKRYAESYVERMAKVSEELFLPEAVVDFDREKVHCLCALSTGGIFGGLYELSEACGYGICVEQSKMELYQETVEVCEHAEVSPYLSMSGGSALVIAAEDWEPDPNLKIRKIGQITDNNDRMVLHQGKARHLNPPRGDELYKIYHSNAVGQPQKE